MSAALEIRGLVVRYGATTAVDGIDLDLARGEVLALLGPNGAGKSSTVEVCAGFRAPSAGRVRVLGVDQADEAVRPRVGVMPQGGGAYPAVRTGEMLHLVAETLFDPGDIVICANPSYFVFLGILGYLDVRAVGVDVDEAGLVFERGLEQ